MSTFIVVPRPTRPHLLPLPHFDLEAAEQLDQAERRLAREVMDGSLPNSVRGIGEQIRRIGGRLAAGRSVGQDQLDRLRQDARRLVETGRADEVRQLRALQSELFVAAVRATEARGEPTLELRQLGGNFVAFLAQGWLRPAEGIVFDDAELRLLFRNHFNTLTGLVGHGRFAPNAEETRWYYATLFEHPPVPPGDSSASDQARLRYVQALGRADSEYDSRLVQGLLHLRMDRPGKATRLLSQYLQDNPPSAWKRVADNALAEGYRRAEERVNAGP